MAKAKVIKTHRMKTTIVIESESDKDLAESLEFAAGLARDYVMQMSFGSKRKNGPHVSIRTTRMRKQKVAA